MIKVYYWNRIYIAMYALKPYTDMTTIEPNCIGKCVRLSSFWSEQHRVNCKPHVVCDIFGALTLSFCLSGKKWLGYKVT